MLLRDSIALPSSAIVYLSMLLVACSSSETEKLSRRLTKTQKIQNVSLSAQALTREFLKLEITEALQLEARQYGLENDQLKYSIQKNMEIATSRGFCFRVKLEYKNKEELSLYIKESNQDTELKWNFTLQDSSSRPLKITQSQRSFYINTRNSILRYQGDVCSSELNEEISGVTLSLQDSKLPARAAFFLRW